MREIDHGWNESEDQDLRDLFDELHTIRPCVQDGAQSVSVLHALQCIYVPWEGNQRRFRPIRSDAIGPHRVLNLRVSECSKPLRDVLAQLGTVAGQHIECLDRKRVHAALNSVMRPICMRLLSDRRRKS